MNVDQKIELTALYDIYYLLLTTRQQEIIEYYLDDDFTVNEIAEKLKVSSAAVSKTLKQSCQKLLELEDKLKIETTYHKNIELLKKNDIDQDIINKIKK